MLTNARTSLTRIIAGLRAPLYLNGYALMLSAVAMSGLGFVFWVLAARMYAPAAVGASSALVSLLMFLAGIAQLNLRGALIRFLPLAGSAARRLILGAYAASIGASLLCGGGMLLVARWWLPEGAFGVAQPAFAVWFIVSVVAQTIFALQDHVLTGLRQAIWTPVENLVYSLAKLALLIALAGSAFEHAIYYAYTIPILALVIPINCFIFTRCLPARAPASDQPSEPLTFSGVARFVAGDYLGALFALMSTTLIPVLVALLLGVEANAYFYLPWTISGALELLAVNMTASFTVEATRERAKLVVYSRRVLGQLLILLALGLSVILPAAPFLLRIIGQEYADASAGLLRLLALSSIPQAVLMLAMSVARVENRVRAIVALQAANCGLLLGLSALMLPALGILAIGWAKLIAQGLLALLLLGTLLRRVW
jgi:O-antigen/teichoic acid export membrane protein